MAAAKEAATKEVEAEVLPGFACACGFASTTQSGLTNHKKSCAQANNRQPAIHADLPLSSQERKSYEKRIIDRRDTMLEALSGQFSGSPDKVIEALRHEKGVTLTVEQLNELIEGVDRQIEEAISTHITDEQDRLKVQLADVDENFDEEEKGMKERHRKEWVDLGERKKEAKKKLNQELKSAKERVMKEQATDLVAAKMKYSSQMLLTRQKEQEIKVEAQVRTALLQKSRGRLEHTIRDAANRALEDILNVTTRKEAADLMYRIPTVGEAVEMCASAEGFGSLLKRLDPSMMLPAPAPEPKVTKKAIEIVAAEVVPPDEDEEREANAPVDSSEHDEIYADNVDDSGRPIRTPNESRYDYDRRLQDYNRRHR